MAKLNKSEREYAVRRMRSMVREANPRPDTVVPDRYIAQVVASGPDNSPDLKLKPAKEVLRIIQKEIDTDSMSYSMRLLLDNLIVPTASYVKAKKAEDEAVAEWAKKTDKVNAELEPIIDSLYLGEAGSEAIAQCAAMLEGVK